MLIFDKNCAKALLNLIGAVFARLMAFAAFSILSSAIYLSLKFRFSLRRRLSISSSSFNLRQKSGQRVYLLPCTGGGIGIRASLRS